jgi:16S rRNA (uracil1498-N3)-methyltransferase
MVKPPERRPGAAASAPSAERRFFLAEAPSGTGKAALAPADAEHARVVLRLVAGDRCIGLDGAGSAWPLVVTASDRRRFEVEVAGDRLHEPAPGEPGARLPWIEVAVALPRGARAETMLDAIVQLGAAAVTPLVTRRSPPPARADGEGRRERLVRITREACKQSGRLWNVELREAVDVAGLAQGRTADFVRLDPRAPSTLTSRLEALGRSAWTRERPLVIVVGPEGGFEADEHRVLDEVGALAASIAPHILRIETAAVAALGIVVDRVHLDRRPAQDR